MGKKSRRNKTKEAKNPLAENDMNKSSGVKVDDKGQSFDSIDAPNLGRIMLLHLQAGGQLEDSGHTCGDFGDIDNFSHAELVAYAYSLRCRPVVLGNPKNPELEPARIAIMTKRREYTKTSLNYEAFFPFEAIAKLYLTEYAEQPEKLQALNVLELLCMARHQLEERELRSAGDSLGDA